MPREAIDSLSSSLADGAYTGVLSQMGLSTRKLKNFEQVKPEKQHREELIPSSAASTAHLSAISAA